MTDKGNILPFPVRNSDDVARLADWLARTDQETVHNALDELKAQYPEQYELLIDTVLNHGRKRNWKSTKPANDGEYATEETEPTDEQSAKETNFASKIRQRSSLSHELYAHHRMSNPNSIEKQIERIKKEHERKTSFALAKRMKAANDYEYEQEETLPEAKNYEEKQATQDISEQLDRIREICETLEDRLISYEIIYIIATHYFLYKEEVEEILENIKSLEIPKRQYRKEKATFYDIGEDIKEKCFVELEARIKNIDKITAEKSAIDLARLFWVTSVSFPEEQESLEKIRTKITEHPRVSHLILEKTHNGMASSAEIIPALYPKCDGMNLDEIKKFAAEKLQSMSEERSR